MRRRQCGLIDRGNRWKVRPDELLTVYANDGPGIVVGVTGGSYVDRRQEQRQNIRNDWPDITRFGFNTAFTVSLCNYTRLREPEPDPRT